jgi:hypothetical protein
MSGARLADHGDVTRYVVHPGTGTVINLDECTLLEIADANVAAMVAIEDEDIEEAIVTSDKAVKGFDIYL